MNDWDDVVSVLGTGPTTGPVLYKRASTGKIQQWSIERDGAKFRTIHGQFGGALIYAEWTICEGKNIGKKNETTPEQQAKLEVEALYKKKREQGSYFDYIADIDELIMFNPMLANTFDAKKVKWPAFVQAKLDGMRCIMTSKGAFSRKGKPIPAAEHIREQLEPVFEKYPDLILDGEIYNHELKSDFQTLMSIAKKQKLTEEDKLKAEEFLNYHIYDCACPGYINGGFGLREEFLWEVIGDGDRLKENDGPYGYPTPYKNVFTVDHWDQIKDEGEVLNRLEQLLIDGYEGAILRQDNIPYENKRTNQLMKVKNFIDDEFEIADIEEGKGNWSGCAKRAILWLPGADKSQGISPDTTFGAGIAGNKEYAKRLLVDRKAAIGQMATVTYFRLTDDGKPYLPVMKIIRDYE